MLRQMGLDFSRVSLNRPKILQGLIQSSLFLLLSTDAVGKFPSSGTGWEFPKLKTPVFEGTIFIAPPPKKKNSPHFSPSKKPWNKGKIVLNGL